MTLSSQVTFGLLSSLATAVLDYSPVIPSILASSVLDTEYCSRCDPPAFVLIVETGRWDVLLQPGCCEHIHNVYSQ